MKKRLLSMILCIMMVVTAVPMTLFTGLAVDDAAEEQAAVTYDDLYVKGATFKWDAFDISSTDEAINVLDNQTGGEDLTLPVAIEMGNKYILYPQTSSNFNLTAYVPTKIYQVGDQTYYKADDYSVEFTVHQYWQDDFVTSGINNNRIEPFGEISNVSGQQQRLTVYFNDPINETNGYLKSAEFYSYSTSFGTSSYNQKTIAEAFKNGLNKPYTIGVNWDFTFDGTSNQGKFYINSSRDGGTIDGKEYGSYLQKDKTSRFVGNQLYFGSVTPFAYYAIRVYPFALTVAQSAQNHFAELCDYFRIDKSALAAFVSLDTDSQKEIRNEYIGVTFDETSKEAIEKTIGDKIKELSEAEEKLALKELYKTLYVEEGREFVWNAFLYGAVKGGYMVDLFDETKTLGDGSVGIEKNSGFGYAAFGGRLDFTPFLKQEDGTYGDALSLEIGLRLTSDIGNIDRFFGPLAHLSNNDGDAAASNKYTYTTAKRTDGFDSYGMIKGPYRSYPLATVATETYYFKSEDDTAPIKKAAYDALSATDKEAYQLSVNVPYYKGSYALAFDQGGWWNGHVIGNYTGETYSFGVTMNFDVQNNSFDFAFLRDTELAKGRAVKANGLLYVPGKAYSGAPTFVAPTDYEAALKNTALENVTFSSWSTTDKGFYFGQASAEYYSVHIYSKELTDMQRKQNHFADIVSYFQPRNIETFIALPTEQKEAIYTLFSDREDMLDAGTRNTSFEDIEKLGGRAYIEDIIEYSGVDFRADSILSFDGYSVKRYGTPAYRATFAVHQFELDEGVALKSAGVLSASGADFDSVTFVQNAAGVYELASADITNTVLYENGAWVDSLLTKTEDGTYAILSKTFGGEQTNETLREKDYYRGYVILEKNGNEQVYYTSMNGVHVGERGVSMYDLATKFHAYPASKSVITVCETASEKTYAVDSFFNEDGSLNTESTEPLTIVCIGCSLTELGHDKTASSGRKVWVEGIRKYFQDRFPNREVTIHNAGVGGTTSSLGAMRFADQVIALNPDLVIIEFTVNDKKYDETTAKVHIENMLLQCLNADKVPAVVYAHTPFAVDKESDKYDLYTRQVGYKEDIVSHYGVSYVNIYDAFYEKYLEKLEEDPDLDYISFLDLYYTRMANPDEFGDYFDVHPKADGYEIYLNAFEKAFDAELEVMLSRLREMDIHCTDDVRTATRVSNLLSHDDERITYEGNWDVWTKEKPYSNADKSALVAAHRYVYPFFDTGVRMAYKQEGASLSFKTTANMLSIYYLAQKAGMTASVYVDGVDVGTFTTTGSAQQPFGGAFIDLGNPEGKEVTVRIVVDAISASNYSFAFGYLAEIYYVD